MKRSLALPTSYENSRTSCGGVAALNALNAQGLRIARKPPPRTGLRAGTQIRFNVDEASTNLRSATELKSEKLDIFNVKLPEKTIRSEAEAYELRKTIALLARVFSKNYNMEVLPAPSGGWACGVDPGVIPEVEAYITGQTPSLDHVPTHKFKPTQIFYDIKDIYEASRDHVYGVLRHEVGHANHSDYPLFFKGQRIAQEQGHHPSTWMQIHNALEDPWVNNLEIKDSELVRAQMTQLYAAHFPEIEAKIDTQPLTHQLGLNLNYYWATGKSIPTLKHKDVLDAFEKVRPHADAFFTGASARENFDNLLNNIWPTIKTLAEKAEKEEEKKELARSLSGSELGSGSGKGSPRPGSGGGRGDEQATSAGSDGGQQSPHQSSGQSRGGQSQGGDGQEENPFRKRADSHNQPQKEEKLPWYKRLFRRKKKLTAHEEAMKRMQDATERERARNEREWDEQNRQQPPPEPVKPQRNDTFEEKLAKELYNQEQEQNDHDRRNTRKSGKKPALSNDISLDKLSREIQQELERKLGALSQGERDELKKKAAENLDRKQAENAGNNSPELEIKKDPKTGNRIAVFRKAPEPKDVEQLKKELEEFLEALEAQEAAESEAARTAEQKRIEKEMQLAQAKRELVKNGFSEAEVAHFRRYRELEGAMKGKIHAFLRALEEYLPKKETTTYEGENYTGSRLNRSAVLRRAPIGDYRVFSRRNPCQSDEPRMFVTLLIDNSGSMGGQKMEESLKTAIFWARVLREFQIPFAIKFFGERVVDIMQFTDDYDDPRKRIKPNIVIKADASGGSTNISDPLERSLDEMRKARRQYPDCFGAIFVISDSGANRGKTGTALQSLIKKVQGEFLVMNFILATKEEADEARGYFGDKNVIAPKSFAELPNDAFKTLRIVLDRVLKIYRPQ